MNTKSCVLVLFLLGMTIVGYWTIRWAHNVAASYKMVTIEDVRAM